MPSINSTMPHVNCEHADLCQALLAAGCSNQYSTWTASCAMYLSIVSSMISHSPEQQGYSGLNRKGLILTSSCTLRVRSCKGHCHLHCYRPGCMTSWCSICIITNCLLTSSNKHQGISPCSDLPAAIPNAAEHARSAFEHGPVQLAVRSFHVQAVQCQHCPGSSVWWTT